MVLQFILTLVVLGLIFWATTLLPLPDPFPMVIKVIFIILLILLLLDFLGVTAVAFPGWR